MTSGFLLLPIAAIFIRTGAGRLLDQLSNPVVQDAFVVTLKTSGVAQALILLLGTPTAYLLATRRFRGRPLAVVARRAAARAAAGGRRARPASPRSGAWGCSAPRSTSSA